MRTMANKVTYGYRRINDGTFKVFETIDNVVSYPITTFDNESDAITFTNALSMAELGWEQSQS